MARLSDDAEQAGPDWAEFRRQMPVTDRWAYLDHAAVGPLAGPARDALREWAEDAAANGSAYYPGWMERIEQLRQRVARLIGAQPREIALVHNTTEGVNLVAEGFPWQPGDNVVTRADEFPTNQYPWMNLASRGVEVRRVPVEGSERDYDRLAEACDRRTRIVSVSWVAYSHGWRHDLDRLVTIAHGCGALLFLDAIQGLGAFPVDVGQTAIDFLAADGHKWMLGPEGAALFFARHEHLELLRPVGVGWNSVVHAHDFTRIELDVRPSAARYEGGSPNTGGMIGFGASLALLERFGLEAIGRRVVEITDLACRRLEEIGAVIRSDRQSETSKSGIVAFELPGRDPQTLRERCFQRSIVLSCRGGRLRISPHAYNDASDIERLVEALK